MGAGLRAAFLAAGTGLAAGALVAGAADLAAGVVFGLTEEGFLAGLGVDEDGGSGGGAAAVPRLCSGQAQSHANSPAANNKPRIATCSGIL